MASGAVGSGGPFTLRCEGWLREHTGAAAVLLTPSCTAALELAVGLLDIGAGDEVVMPSFTSAATATAVARRGAVPVFADIRPDTLTIDPAAVARLMTRRTRAIIPVHYAGVACDVEHLADLARDHGAALVEDAAQGLGATSRGRPLGTLGDAGCLSFHATKNVTCGEGGALLLRGEEHAARAAILQDKGTDRRRFLSGAVDHYTWHEPGASATMSELTAAVLWAQLQDAERVTEDRRATWAEYHWRLAELEEEGRLRRPIVPEGAAHNGHISYVLLEDPGRRAQVIERLAAAGVQAAFHYVALHASPAGRRWCRTPQPLPVTEAAVDRILRLPLWAGMESEDVARVVDALALALG